MLPMIVCDSKLIKLWEGGNKLNWNRQYNDSITHLHQVSKFKKDLSIKPKIMERDSLWLFGLYYA